MSELERNEEAAHPHASARRARSKWYIASRDTQKATGRDALLYREVTNQLPRIVEFSLYSIVAIVAFFGLIKSGKEVSFATEMLDAWFVLTCAVLFFRGKLRAPVALGLFVIYCVSRFVPLLYTSAPTSEFLRAYRWLLYLTVFLLAIGWEWSTRRLLTKLTISLLCVALTKYVVTVLLKGMDSRPTLFLENNFELPLFVGLVVVTYKFLGKWKAFAVFLVAGLVLLGQSLSGALAFACLIAFVLWDLFQSHLRLRPIIPLLGFSALLAPIAVVLSRKQVASDRAKFLDVFLGETASWHIDNWILGTMPLTPLSPEGCSRLSYWTSLTFNTDLNQCYSVILHSFGLRVIFDAGITGAIIAFAVPVFACIAARVQPEIWVTLIAIAATNALSVSSLNNPYMAMPIVLAILVCGKPRLRAPTNLLPTSPGLQL